MISMTMGEKHCLWLAIIDDPIKDEPIYTVQSTGKRDSPGFNGASLPFGTTAVGRAWALEKTKQRLKFMISLLCV